MSKMMTVRVLGVLFLGAACVLCADGETAASPSLASNEGGTALGVSRSWTPRISVNLGYDSKYKIEGITVDDAGLALSGEITMAVDDFYVSFRGRRTGRHEQYESPLRGLTNAHFSYDADEEFFSDMKFSLGYTPTLEDVPLLGKVKLNLAAMFSHFAPAFAENRSKGKLFPSVVTTNGDSTVGNPYTVSKYPGVYFRNVTTPQGISDFDSVDTYYKSHAFDENAFGLSFGFTLEDVFLKPNATVVWEPENNRLWGQFGVQYDMPLDFISERLTWSNTLDFYWYRHGFWKGETVYHECDQNFTKWMSTLTTIYYSVDNCESWNEYGSISSDPTTKTKYTDPGLNDRRVDRKTKTSLPNGIWRSSLTYALTDAASLSFYTALEYNFDRDFLEDFSGSVDTLEGYCGVQLNMVVGASRKSEGELKLGKHDSIWPKGWEPQFTLKTGYDSKYKVHGQTISDDHTYSAELGITAHDFFFALRGVYAHEQPSRENQYDGVAWERGTNDYVIDEYTREFDKEGLAEWSATLGYNYAIDALPVIGRMTLTPTVYFTHRAPCFSRTKQKSVMDSPELASYGYDNLVIMYSRSFLPEDTVDFSLGVTLNDVFLSPNANIAWEPFENRLWAQVGIKYDYVLDFLSDRLTWQNSLDFYWYKRGFWESTLEYDCSEQFVELGEPRHEKVRDEKSEGGVANGIFRTALAYAITDSISLTVYEAVEYNFEREIVENCDWSKNKEYTSYFGAQLVFGF